MDIDEQLISQNTQSQEAELAGELRASKRGGMQERGEDENASLRERVQQKRVEETKKGKEDYKATPPSAQLNPIRQSTDKMLAFAWENLITSFGLTLIWIDVHVFLNKVFGSKVFCDPGEEWLPDSIKKLAGESKSAASLLRIVEGSGIGCLNLGCLFIVLFLMTMLSIITSILTGDVKVIWDLFTGLIEEIAALFS